jgi:hypothetical protein
MEHNYAVYEANKPRSSQVQCVGSSVSSLLRLGCQYTTNSLWLLTGLGEDSPAVKVPWGQVVRRSLLFRAGGSEFMYFSVALREDQSI